MPRSKSRELGFVRATEPGMIGKMRGRNDLNAMSRRSSSDLVSLSSFLRSSSAFRLAELRTGSHLFFTSRNLSCAMDGSVRLIFSSFRLLISLPPCRKHSRLRCREASRTEAVREEDLGFSPDSPVNNHAEAIFS